MLPSPAKILVRALGRNVPGSPQLRQDLDVAVLDRGQAPIQVALLRVFLRVGEKPVQVRRVRLVLPMVMEGVEVGGSAAGRRRWGGGGLGHVSR